MADDEADRNRAGLLTCERALDRPNWSRLALHSGVLGLALLTHYSALVFTASISLYCWARFIAARADRFTLRRLALVHIALGCLILPLYLTHIRLMHGSPLEQGVLSTWLSTFYLQPNGSPVWFVLRGTVDVFSYFFGRQPGVWGVTLVLMIGFFMLFVLRKFRPTASPRLLAILIVAPFILFAVAALLRLFPYGGTRHDAVLAIPLIIVVSYPLSRVPGRRLVVVSSAMALAFVLVFRTIILDPQTLIDHQPRDAVIGNLRQPRSQVPPGSVMLLDRSNDLVFSFYMNPAINPLLAKTNECGFDEYQQPPYRVLRFPKWQFTKSSRAAATVTARPCLDDTESTKVWSFDLPAQGVGPNHELWTPQVIYVDNQVVENNSQPPTTEVR